MDEIFEEKMTLIMWRSSGKMLSSWIYHSEYLRLIDRRKKMVSYPIAFEVDIEKRYILRLPKQSNNLLE